MEGVHAVTYAGSDPQEAWDALEANPDAVLVDCRTSRGMELRRRTDPEILGKRTVFIEWSVFPTVRQPGVRGASRDAGVRDSDEVIFICRSGHRSIGAAEAATAAGVAKAYNVLDGFEGAR